METSQVSINRWVDKECMMCVYIYKHTYTIEYHSALKEGNRAICEAMGKSRDHYAE